MGQKRPRVLRPRLDCLDVRCLLSAGLTPAQVTQAYGLNNLTASGTKLTGAGQTIALIEAYTNPNLAQELAGFDSAYSLTPLTVSSTVGGGASPTLTQVNMATGSNASQNTNAGWAQEEALDVEWAHAIAPGANLLVVEATSPSTQALMEAVQYAETHGATVVSMSWGGSESKATESQYDSSFNKAGITFVASSGDTATGGAEWPATSPYVLAVGGTSLKVATSSGATTYVSESAWNDAYGGSSGGLSAYESEPSYQETAQTSGRRAVPDVAFVGDPATGVSVYYVAPRMTGANVSSGGD